MLLFFSRHCCCQQWHHRQYNDDQKSLCERLFSSSSIKNQQNTYITNDDHFPNTFENRTNLDDIYSNGRTYVTSKTIEVEKETNYIRLLANGIHPITVVSDKTIDDITENIDRKIIKNYIINATQNYYVQKDSVQDEYYIKHNQDIQTLPGPTITTINMAAERVTDDINWEKIDPIDVNNNLLSNSKTNRSSKIKLVTAQLVINDPSVFLQNVNYEKQPNIYICQPNLQQTDKYSFNRNKKISSNNRQLRVYFHQMSNNDDSSSTINETDSESTYKKVDILTPKKQSLTSLEAEDEHKTAGIDEVEIEIKNLVRLQKTNNIYNDTLSSINIASLSPSSTLQNLISQHSQNETNQRNQVDQTSSRLQHEGIAFSISPPSSNIRYIEQPTIHY